uniref:Senescence regulator n=1 Tax=Leersia perrieri TaxID=77586 RepID=A0A0D9XKQ8_9ORYZ
MAGRSGGGMSMVAAHRLFSPSPATAQHGGDLGVELDEADVIWGAGTPSSSSPVESYLRSTPPQSSSKGGKLRAGGGGAVGKSAAAAASMPVNIPDWSKILGAEYRGSAGAARWPSDDRDGCAAGGEVGWVPPHELLLCRERAAASFSVREGAGRTLKGRDLRRVRNAIWEKTGFQD